MERHLTPILQTNASLLFPRRLDRLVNTGFQGSIYVSCHGITPHVYRSVMGLDIKRTLANVDYLLSRFPRNVVRIRAIPYKWPWGEVLKVKRYWQERKVRLKLVVPNSRSGLVYDCLSWRWKYPGERLQSCKKFLSLRDMIISFDGEVLLCCEDMGRMASLGSVRGKSLLEVWNSPRAHQVRRQVFALDKSPTNFPCKSCEFGVSTPFRRFIRSLDHEFTRIRTCLV